MAFLNEGSLIDESAQKREPDGITFSQTGVAYHYLVPLSERLTVWLRNLWHWRTAWAVRHLSKQLRKDKAFRESWQANIAMPIYDGTRIDYDYTDSNGIIVKGVENMPIQQANDIADRLMKHLFGV